MFDEIILVNNNSYGAPELKKLYQGFTLKGFIIAVTFHLALIAAYMLITYFNEAKAKDIPKGKDPIIIVDFDETPPPVDDKELPSCERGNYKQGKGLIHTSTGAGKERNCR